MSPAPAALAVVVTLPLLGAMAAVAAPRQGGRLAVTSAAGTLVAALALVVAIINEGAVAVAVGRWQPPLGILLRADGPSALFLTATALIMTSVALYALRPIAARGRNGRLMHTFWPVLMLLLGALNVIFVSRDLFNLYVGLELASLSAVALVASEGRRETLAAALRYLLFALTGSLLYLLGTALLYGAHGTLDLGLLATSLGTRPGDGLALAAMTAGLAAKTALFPFHVWLAPAHAGAPAPASAVLSALVPKASFFILVRLWFEGAPGLAGEAAVSGVGVLGAAAVVHGSLMGLRQERLKLVIAYSTVAQIGYLFLVFPLAAGSGVDPAAADAAWRGTWFQALSHALAKATLFLCAGLVVEATGHDRLGGLAGTARALPMTLFAFGIAAITLMGLPPTGGFIAKYLLVNAAFQASAPLWALVVLLGGLLAAANLFRPLAAAFRTPAPAGAVPKEVATALPEIAAPGAGDIGPWRQGLLLALAMTGLLLGLFPAVPAALMGGVP